MNTRKVTEPEITHAVAQAVQGAEVRLLPLDANYFVASEADTMQAVKDSHTDAMRYVSDIADCDKHSRLLYAMLPYKFGLNSVCMVIDWSGKHSYNAIVVDNAGTLEVRWVEPQSDSEIKLHSQPCYALKSGSILL